MTSSVGGAITVITPQPCEITCLKSLSPSFTQSLSSNQSGY